jgi:hypothetical protein
MERLRGERRKNKGQKGKKRGRRKQEVWGFLKEREESVFALDQKLMVHIVSSHNIL